MLHRTSQANEPTFCNAALPIRVIDGKTLAVQIADTTGSGCGTADTTPGMETLGTDCRVRSEDGTVIETMTSSRADGTCGSDSPAP